MKWFVSVMVLLTASDAIMGDWIAGEFGHDRFDWLEATMWVATAIILQSIGGAKK